MSQNLISLRIDANRFSAIDAAVTALEKQLDDFVELSVEQRRELLKLGPRSEVFCRATIDVMERNPGALPADFDLDAIREDRVALAQVRPLLSRLRMLISRVQDTGDGPRQRSLQGGAGGLPLREGHRLGRDAG